MHKHVSNHLPYPEIRAVKVMNSQNLSHHRPAEDQGSDIENDIDDQQIFYYWRDIRKWG